MENKFIFLPDSDHIPETGIWVNMSYVTHVIQTAGGFVVKLETTSISVRDDNGIGALKKYLYLSEVGQ